MSQFVEVEAEGALGVITLKRPEAINALDLPMILAIDAALDRFAADEAVRVVLLEGEGLKGFCAGGDVRAVRQQLVAGEIEAGLGFFAAEYQVNRKIATFDKPLVALTHGVVMGGGIGLAGHCRFRFTTDDSRFAMPEGAIGFVADVGVNFILAKAMPERALHFLLTGDSVGPASAQSLGLTDCVIPRTEMAAVRSRIALAASAADVEVALTAIMQTDGIHPGEPQSTALADRLAAAYSAHDLPSLLVALDDLQDGAVVAETLRKRCPTSLTATLRSYRASRGAQSIDDVLARDLRLARYMAQRADFIEGVRAVLVDKDHLPVWAPSRFEDVDLPALIAAVG